MLKALAKLRKRALSSGVSKEAVEGALDLGDPKAALVSLVVARRMEVGVVGDLVETLRGGGEEAAAAVTEMLERVTELLDAQSSATPRKSRKGLLELLDRVESVCESIDAEWCDGVAVCEGEELERLGSLLVGASDLGDGVSAEEAVSMVSELLDCVEECGSVVVQAVSGLRRAAAGGVGGDDARLGAFEMLRCLSPERQGSVSSKEALAAELVMECLASESGSDVGCQLRESGCMALFALGCRNGVAVCGTMEFVSVTHAMMQTGFESLVRLVKAESPDSDVLAELAASSAATLCGFSLSFEAVYKLPAAVRGPLEKKLMAETTHHVGVSKLYTDAQICRLLSLVMEHRLFYGDDLSLACGLPATINVTWYVHM